jgi:hypothetical protein
MDCPRCDAIENDMQMQREANRSLRMELELERQTRVACQNKVAVQAGEIRGLQAELSRVRADRTYNPEPV